MEMNDQLRRAMHRPPTLRQPGTPSPVAAPQAALEPSAPATTAKPKVVGLGKPKGRRAMNRTEAAYALILEAKKRSGMIVRYGWEEITLRWPDGMRYTPDFCVWYPNVPNELVFIETKGPFIEGDALVKFRAARAFWPEFEFKMMQRAKDKTWSRIL